MKTALLIGTVSAGSHKWGKSQPPAQQGVGWCSHAGSRTQYADLNGDGQSDMICDDNKGTHWVKFSYGNGQWRDRGIFLKGWCGHPGAYTQYADINGDGKDDIICDDSKGTHWVRLSTVNGGTRDLGIVQRGWCGHAGSRTSWADINGDGKADMLCDDNRGNHWIKLGLGNGKFRDLGLKLRGWCVHGGSYTQWADSNGDGKADMHCDDAAGRHWINISNGNGTFRDLNGPVVSGWCSHAGSHTSWADINGDGKADMLCDDNKGNHWAKLSNGGRNFIDLGLFKTGWCVHPGSYTQWADTSGDGNADMHCDDTKGNHWIMNSYWMNS